MTLLAVLRSSRDIPGDLTAIDEDSNVLHRCPVLARADNARAKQEGNPTRNPLLPFGDTPTGLWRCRKHGPVAPASTYGANPVITLTPISGNALAASRRSGIWLHGGAPGALSAWAYLRPTFGCLRISDDDVRQIWLLAATFGDPETIEVREA